MALELGWEGRGQAACEVAICGSVHGLLWLLTEMATGANAGRLQRDVLTCPQC